MGPEVHPGRGESLEPAKALCGACLVRPECLLYALEHDEPHGVWGGLSAQERSALLRVERASELVVACTTSAPRAAVNRGREGSRFGERVSRLKFSERITGSGELSTLFEAETLSLGIEGELAVTQTP